MITVKACKYLTGAGEEKANKTREKTFTKTRWQRTKAIKHKKNSVVSIKPGFH